MLCNQCDAHTVQGVLVHERGCINDKARICRLCGDHYTRSTYGWGSDICPECEAEEYAYSIEY
jgi:hypothetical protein